MSQPPYGSEPTKPEQQTGPQAYQPYGQPPPSPYGPPAYPTPYPNPYAQLPQQPRSHTTRNVLLVVGALVVLFCGGLVALVAVAVNNVGDSFDSDYPGSEKDPLTVEEGEAFTIRGFDVDAGWSVQPEDQTKLVTVAGLTATNHRDDDDTDSVFLTFEFYKDDVRLSSATCNGGVGIAPDRSAQLDCTGYGDVGGFDEIEVHDTSYYE